MKQEVLLLEEEQANGDVEPFYVREELRKFVLSRITSDSDTDAASLHNEVYLLYNLFIDLFFPLFSSASSIFAWIFIDKTRLPIFVTDKKLMKIFICWSELL